MTTLALKDPYNTSLLKLLLSARLKLAGSNLITQHCAYGECSVIIAAWAEMFPNVDKRTMVAWESMLDALYKNLPEQQKINRKTLAARKDLL